MTSPQGSSHGTCASLIARLQTGDDDAWPEFVQLYSPMVYHWCRHAGLPPSEIPDLFQDVFATVSQNIRRFRARRDGGSFRGWLRTVTRNKVIDAQRRAGRVPQGRGGTESLRWLEQLPQEAGPTSARDSLPPAPTADATASSMDPAYPWLFQQVLTRIRPHFKKQTWTAFWRVVVEGRPVADVADELDMKPGTVRVAKSRVLSRMRLELGDLDPGPTSPSDEGNPSSGNPSL